MVLYIVDKRIENAEPGLVMGIPKGKHSARSDVLFVQVDNVGLGMGKVVQKAVTAMKKYSKDNQSSSSIDFLSIDAHGTGGSVQLGVGLWEGNAHYFSALRGLMASGGVCEIDACSVADINSNADADVGTGNGEQLLARLSIALQCKVRAAKETQYGDDIGEFEGVWITAHPPSGVLTSG